jgi:hypothetical protein
MRISRCSSCGTRTATSSARKEGKDWFCSQSCLLEYESKAGHARAPSRKAHRRRGPVRAIGKAIKWTVIVGVLAVVALIVVAAVDLGRSADKSSKASHRAALAFRHIKRGMTEAQVRRLAGKPSSTDASVVGIGADAVRQECWYYGNALSGDREYDLCFEHGRLTDTLRLSP